MPTPAGNGVGAAARRVADPASALARLELELAGLEVKRKLGSLALGIGLLAAAAVLGLFVLAFGLAAGAAGLATVLPTWAALLIVAGALAGLASLLGLLGLGRIRKGAPPVPDQAIAEARKTTEALKNGED